MNQDRVIAVTGANGYVGGVIARALQPAGRIIRLVRKPETAGDVAWSLDMAAAQSAQLLKSNGVTCLVHAAWDMNASSAGELERVSVAGSARVLAAAREAGIGNMIFISTISAFEQARSAYGRSKLQVEQQYAQHDALILRLGLVYGPGEGGVFGNLRRVARKARVIPLIGDGRAPQYLLDEESLGAVMRRAVAGDFAGQHLPVTVANPKPVPFRDLLRGLAGPGRNPVLLPVPWRLLYLILRCTEMLGLRLGFRSDSVLSFVFQNPAPDFTQMRDLGIEVRDYPAA